jgi:hypothetical protein
LRTVWSKESLSRQAPDATGSGELQSGARPVCSKPRTWPVDGDGDGAGQRCAAR